MCQDHYDSMSINSMFVVSSYQTFHWQFKIYRITILTQYKIQVLHNFNACFLIIYAFTLKK